MNGRVDTLDTKDDRRYLHGNDMAYRGFQHDYIFRRAGERGARE